jgi:hypothetical protein
MVTFSKEYIYIYLFIYFHRHNMSVHKSDNEELEVVDINNSESGPSTVCKPIGDNIAKCKRKYTEKR